MEHPPKQGLKPERASSPIPAGKSFNGTSTKTRIETVFASPVFFAKGVLMEHPPKQGLKQQILGFPNFSLFRF